LFGDLFKRYDGDFYKIDPFLFSPAKITMTNVVSGRTFRAGCFNPELLRASLLG
jgi:methenyltetrahydromethanopterin cyclohydrolase